MRISRHGPKQEDSVDTRYLQLQVWYPYINEQHVTHTEAVVCPPSSSIILLTFGFVSVSEITFTGAWTGVVSVFSGICAMEGAIIQLIFKELG